jgi:hypothetical protein
MSRQNRSTMLIEYDIAFCAFQTANIPFYMLFAWTLIRYRKSRLASPFFALCLSSAVVDICHLIHFTSLYHLNIDGWAVARALLSNPTGPLPKYKMIGAFYLGQVQIFAAVLIAFNRFTALAIPFKHDSVNLKSINNQHMNCASDLVQEILGNRNWSAMDGASRAICANAICTNYISNQ